MEQKGNKNVILDLLNMKCQWYILLKTDTYLELKLRGEDWVKYIHLKVSVTYISFKGNESWVLEGNLSWLFLRSSRHKWSSKSWVQFTPTQHIWEAGKILRGCTCARSVTQSCLTLCDPMDCSSPGSSVHGMFQPRMLEWVVISYSRGSSPPRDRTLVFCISFTAR